MVLQQGTSEPLKLCFISGLYIGQVGLDVCRKQTLLIFIEAQQGADDRKKKKQ